MLSTITAAACWETCVGRQNAMLWRFLNFWNQPWDTLNNWHAFSLCNLKASRCNDFPVTRTPACHRSENHFSKAFSISMYFIWWPAPDTCFCDFHRTLIFSSFWVHSLTHLRSTLNSFAAWCFPFTLPYSTTLSLKAAFDFFFSPFSTCTTQHNWSDVNQY